MQVPTVGEIRQEIEKLRELKPRVPERSFFGDSNHEQIDAQLDVLENGLEEDDIYNTYEDDEDESSQNLVSAALDARAWLDGEEGPPSKGWEGIAK